MAFVFVFLTDLEIEQLNSNKLSVSNTNRIFANSKST